MASVWLAVSLDHIVGMSGVDMLSVALRKGNVKHLVFFLLICFSAVASLWFCKTVLILILFV